MRVPRLSLVALALLSAMLPVASAAPREPSGCTEETPDVVSTAMPDAPAVPLRVLIFNDHVPPAHVATALKETARVLATAGVKATFVVKRLDLRAEGTNAEGEPALSVETAHAASRKATGGKEPRGIDIVHLLTTRDLYQAGTYTVAGHAECIGGIRYAGWSYSASEAELRVRYLKGTSIVMQPDNTGRNTAHEIGHLLGAHHHYGTCGETAAEELTRSRGGVCSVMFPDSAVHGGRFDALNARIVRGHVEKYGGPAD